MWWFAVAAAFIAPQPRVFAPLLALKRDETAAVVDEVAKLLDDSYEIDGLSTSPDDIKERCGLGLSLCEADSSAVCRSAACLGWERAS